MKAPLFEYPSFQYQIQDWDFKKKAILNRLGFQKFVRTDLQNFETDRQTNNKSYVRFLSDLLQPELSEFCQEAEVSCTMTDAWAVRYKNGDDQSVHNHRSWGFSGVIYLEYDPKVHKPTYFIAPWQDPRSDTTTFGYFRNVQEGMIAIVPSYTLHFVPPNKSNKQRTIIAFDLLPKLPEHQIINI